ncbi:MAG: PA2169 family four-helix-bundle protein [Phycisphaerae bacterium]|nr:PA2169 family four-helix-bundle protein [Saprospiraceae bacterium]
MYQNEKLIGILNDLVRINHDRVYGYEHAIEDLGNGNQDLKTIFLEKISQSRLYASRLESYIRDQGGNPTTDTTVSGKLFRVWMDFKATLMGHDTAAVLNSCVFGENAALEAYETALDSPADIPSEMLQTLVQQRETIRSSHTAIKTMAEMQEQMAD